MDTETTISDLDPAVSIDPVTDWLAIDQTTETNKINRNTLLGITGTPVGTTDLQTLTNKTLTGPTISAPVLSGTVTGTYTLGGTPTFPSTIVTTTGSQTLTNKTLTAPVISGGSISNTTIAVDSISEYTSANGVTVDGLNIKDGKLNSNNSVVTSNITDAAVTPNKLVSGSGTGWSWQSWTPTLVNLSGGTLMYADYAQIGKSVFFKFLYKLGGAGVAGGVAFSAPVPMSGDYSLGATESFGIAILTDTGTAIYEGQSAYNQAPAGYITIRRFSVSGSNIISSPISSTTPFTWGVDDTLYAEGTYEAA